MAGVGGSPALAVASARIQPSLRRRERAACGRIKPWLRACRATLAGGAVAYVSAARSGPDAATGPLAETRAATLQSKPEADILTTNEPGILLAIRTADCLPILIADPERRAIAAVHAGW